VSAVLTVRTLKPKRLKLAITKLAIQPTGIVHQDSKSPRQPINNRSKGHRVTKVHKHIEGDL